MEIPFPVTLGVLAVFLLVAIVPPRLPLVARLAIQVIAGAGIYFGLSEAEFVLPMADSLPMSSLFGGDGGGGQFNKFAMGFVAPLLGVVFSVVVAILRKLFGKKAED
jgi:hypothetical protein